jgi:uncharacterized protein YdaU (DUF1376 family)
MGDTKAMKAPSFQFYADDFIGGTCAMTPAEVGAYLRLLCYQWGQGSIPQSDPDKLARIAGGPVSPDVLAKFTDGKNDKMERVRAERAAFIAKQTANGHLGGRPQKPKPNPNQTHGLAKPNPTPNPNETSPVSGLRSPTPASGLHPKPPTAAKPPSDAGKLHDALFDALATACGSDPRQMPLPAARACGVALAAIRKVAPNVTAADFAIRARNYRRHLRDAVLTPSALCNQWSLCAHAPGGFVAPAPTLAAELWQAECPNWRDLLADATCRHADSPLFCDEWRHLTPDAKREAWKRHRP